MTKINIAELEKRYQLTADRASVDEIFEMYEQYRAYLEEQIEENPRNIPALIHLGKLSWEPFHENEKAIEYLERAIAYDPKNVEARFWLATCYYHDYCAYEKTKQLLIDALQIEPNKPECLQLFSIIIMNTSEDLDEAIRCYEKAIYYAPDWPMLRIQVARLYLKIKNVKSAEIHVKKALECKPLTTKPKNDIEEYHERVITGRSWKNLEEKFKPLMEEIQHLKGSLNAQNLVTKILKNKETK